MASEPGASGLQPEDGAARAFEAEFLRSFGPLPPVDTCPIGWQPGALTPVFYSYRDYTSQLVNAPPEVSRGGGGLPFQPPANIRVFFPSLDGSPQYAAILQGCGHYP